MLYFDCNLLQNNNSIEEKQSGNTYLQYAPTSTENICSRQIWEQRGGNPCMQMWYSCRKNNRCILWLRTHWNGTVHVVEPTHEQALSPVTKSTSWWIDNSKFIKIYEANIIRQIHPEQALILLVFEDDMWLRTLVFTSWRHYIGSTPATHSHQLQEFYVMG